MPRRLIAFVAIAGLVLTLGQFALVQNEVTRFLERQAHPDVTEAIARLQQRVSQDQFLVKSIGHILAAEPDVTPALTERVVSLAMREQSFVSYVYRFKVGKGGALDQSLLLNLASPEGQPFGTDRLPELEGIIRKVHDHTQTIATVLPENGDDGAKWLAIIRPIRTKAGASDDIVVGLTPLPRLLAQLYNLVHSRELVWLTIAQTNDSQAEAFVNLEGSEPPFSVLSPVEGSEKIHLEDKEWLVSYATMPGSQAYVMALLPLLILIVGATLTLALILYLRLSGSRGAEISALAESLRHANEELSRRIEDEEKMAHALRESEQKYRAIFENAGIGICQIAPTGEWINANRTIAQILGFESVQELLLAQPDLHGQLFVDPHVRRDWFTRLTETSQRGQEAELRTRDGRTVWVNMTGHAVRDPMGDVIHFECTMYDRTERRKSELDLIRAKEQADFANRSKSEFLANMSHELRTPLNAIIGFSEIIRDQLFGPVGQQQYVEYAGDIYESGSLLLSLINDILDMSKIEAGKRELAETVMDVEQTSRSVMRLVAARAKAGKVKLTMAVPRDIASLRGEERAIKQILTNLLTNAIKFTPEGGTVSLAAERDELGRLIIKVQDTGIGMSAEEIPIAMAPFGQIESALSRKNQGTGLGLPLTRALVELHGGTLDLQSKVGIGTLVTLTFPAERVVGRG